MNAQNMSFFFLYKMKNTLHYPKSAAMGINLETRERIQNTRGKRVISVRATDVLLYVAVEFFFL